MLPDATTYEKDFSVVSETYVGETALYVGVFEKGEYGVPVLINSQLQFKSIFGRGIGIFAPHWYQVFNYLKYSSGIYVVRVRCEDSTNATSEIGNEFYPVTMLSISNSDDFYNVFDNDNDTMFISKTVGGSGNLLSVHVVEIKDYVNDVDIFGIRCKTVFSYFNSGYTGIVVARDGSIVENFYVKTSTLSTHTNLNTEPFSSKYIFYNMINYDSSQHGLYNLSGGTTSLPLEEDYQAAYDIFEDKSTYLIDNIITNQDVPNMAINLANSREDCLIFMGLPVSLLLEVILFDDFVWMTEDDEILVNGDTVYDNRYNIDDVKNFISELDDCKYLVFVNNIKVQYDGYTNENILVNIAGDIAGLKSQASVTSIYAIGSGLNRGLIKDMVKPHISWTKPELTEMYSLNCNFISGGALMSQRTFIDENDKYSRINIVTLFNHLNREIERITLYTVFELLDTYSINAIKLRCKNILETALSQRAITQYEIVVSSNITGDLVAPDTVIVEVYIKPSSIAENIILNVYNNGTTSIS